MAVAEGCEVEANIYYAGFDIPPERQATSHVDCACMCNKTVGCNFWSYWKPGGGCTFHTIKAGRKAHNDFVSGNLPCCSTSGPEVMPSYADQYRGCCSWR